MFNDSLYDFDDLLSSNRRECRSPIIHLPEVLLYDYDAEAIIECGKNFRYSAISQDDDPVRNTLTYYQEKFAESMSDSALNETLNIILNNRYSIFCIDNNIIYLVSLLPGEVTFCIDSISRTADLSKYDSYELRDLWEHTNPVLSLNDLMYNVYKLVNENDYQMDQSLAKLIKSNPDYQDKMAIAPSYVYESCFVDEAENEDSVWDTPWDVRESTFDIYQTDLTPAMEARKKSNPDEDIEAGISNLEKMSSEDEKSPKAAKEPSNTPATSDDTEDAEDSGANDISVDEQVNQQLKSRGQSTPDEIMDENENDDSMDGLDAESEESDEETGEEDESDEDTDNEESTDDPIDTDEEDEESSADKEIEDTINDPDAKKKYRARFVNLYNHIKDVIDTLEGFSPQYNSKYTDQYYAVQTNLHRLKSAIYKICTTKMNDMSTYDVMKAYTTANYAYDTIAQMLKEFSRQYTRECRRANKKKSNNDKALK